MEFEFDSVKSESNFEKHGIDFNEAQALWEDGKLLEIFATAYPEERYFAFGIIGFKVWTAVYTYRNNVIRLISVRRARKSEMELYENQN